MPSQPQHLDPAVIIFGIVALVITWYFYQIASRKTEWLRYKLKRLIVAELCFIGTAYILAQQKLPAAEVVLFSVLIGLGCGFLLVKEPRTSKRISKALRQQVIARDLTSKGLKWDAAKHHIDHVVPFSRGGDNSLKNLRVVEKQRNLRKGGKMPGLLDFLRK
jgi:hypothetical protein